MPLARRRWNFTAYPWIQNSRARGDNLDSGLLIGTRIIQVWANLPGSCTLLRLNQLATVPVDGLRPAAGTAEPLPAAAADSEDRLQLVTRTRNKW